ncbi:MAG: hypothetical protein ACPGQM_05575 [Alphaproteobacteria bacterium]
MQARNIASRERRVQFGGKRRQLFSRKVGGADQVEAATLIIVAEPDCIGGAQNLP